MLDRLFGVETEYALVGLADGDQPVSPDRILPVLVDTARTTTPHLPCCGATGIFLANGSRFYVDCGSHPEMTTPECTDPWEAVRYVRAGERLLQGWAEAAQPRIPGLKEILILRNNVDYSLGSRATWGRHESYLHVADPATVRRQLVPHLASRLIYTGSGGFDSLSPGLQFLLSPRVPHLTVVESEDSTRERGIVHTRDETLARRGYHRLHLLCGDTLCSEMATWLKLGTTALLVALIDAGLSPGKDVALKSPLRAMRVFAADPDCRARVSLAGGGGITAIGIQRRLLEMVEAHRRDSFMPAWASELCGVWREMLDHLEADPRRLSRCLDWAIKLEIFRGRARRHGIAWESFPLWTRVLRALKAAVGKTPLRGQSLRVEAVLAPDTPVPGTVDHWTPYLREHGLDWDQLRPFMNLRQELFEIDLRFGRLGGEGLFAILDRDGLLDHHVPGVVGVDQAMLEPPARGRARVRGEVIRRLAGRPNRMCDWSRIVDFEERRVLDLTDPFAVTEHWRAFRDDNPLDMSALVDFLG